MPSRDSEGRLQSVESESQQEISGPLGIWPFPILNALLSANSSGVTVTEIHRDEDGRIQSIEEIEL